MPALTRPVPADRPTFLGAPRCADLDALDAQIAVIGVPYSTPYDMQGSYVQCGPAPAAIRAQSARLIPMLRHYNFDFDGPVLGDPPATIADCGDVAMLPGRHAENRRAATTAIQTILGRGAFPIILGGDHGVTTPALAAYEGRGSLCVVQLDAHLDWRDEVNGERYGQSSPMRRGSEMPWVRSMMQIGLRAAGSARQAEVDAARAFGSVLIPAETLHRLGPEEVLRRLPASADYYITLDVDGLEPAIAPGTGFAPAGGLSYYQTLALLRGVAARGRVVGFDFVEVAPSLDIADMTSFLAAQIIVSMLGTLAQAGQFVM